MINIIQWHCIRFFARHDCRNLLCVSYGFLCTLSCLAIYSDRQLYGLSILNQRSSHSHNLYGLPSSPWVLARLLLWHIVPLHPISPPSPCWRMPHCFRRIFLGPTISRHVALLPAIIAISFKSLSLRTPVVILLSSLRLCSSLMTPSFVTVFVSTFGRWLIVAPTFTRVECFFFTL